jgi:hypothetical protein
MTDRDLATDEVYKQLMDIHRAITRRKFKGSVTITADGSGNKIDLYPYDRTPLKEIQKITTQPSR